MGIWDTMSTCAGKVIVRRVSLIAVIIAVVAPLIAGPQEKFTVSGIGGYPISKSITSMWLAGPDRHPLLMVYFHGPDDWHNTKWKVASKFEKGKPGWAEFQSEKATLRLSMNAETGEAEVQSGKFKISESNTFLVCMQVSPRFRRKSSRSVCSIFLLRKISRLQFCCFERIQNLWSVSTKTLQPTITSNSSRGEWSVRQTQQACSQLNHHIPVLDLDRINGDPGVGIVGGLAGLRVVLPAVPGTDKLVAFDNSLAQGAAAMQADIVHRRDGAVHVSDADHSFANSEFFGFTFRREVGLSGELDEGHC